ncbi:MAG: V-type ATPase subunit [Patescibacteria group bacterium]
MYEYLTGLIRVLEKRLPDKTDIDRMIQAKTAKDVFDVLNDTDYADNLLNRKPEDYDQVLADDFNQLKKLLAESIGKTPLFDLLFIDFDFLNIKTILKQKFLKLDKTATASQPISNLSLETAENIKKILLLKHQLAKLKAKKRQATAIELAGGKIDAQIADTVNQIKKMKFDANIEASLKCLIDKLRKTKPITPSLIDTACDQELLKLKQLLAKKIKNKFIDNLIKMHIDFLNTKILLRTYETKFKTPFIKGGLIDKNRLMHLYKADKQVFYTNLAELFELYEISHVIDKFKEKKDLWRLERELDSRTFDFVHTASKSASFGPEVIVSYFLNKMTGARNVRTILSGKLNGVEMEEIRERVIV